MIHAVVLVGVSLALASAPVSGHATEGAPVVPGAVLGPVDRSAPPTVLPASPPAAPVVVEARLSGGIPATRPPEGARVFLVERHTTPLVQIELSLQTGALVESTFLRPGQLAALGAIWGKGTRAEDDDAWLAEIQSRGGVFTSACDTGRCWFALAAPPDAVPDLLRRVATLVHAPALPSAELTRWAGPAEKDWRTDAWGAGITHESAVRRLMWPEHHPNRYSERVAADFHQGARQVRETWRTVLEHAQPSVVVAGDTTLDAMLPLLEECFGDLRGRFAAATGSARFPGDRAVVVDYGEPKRTRVTVAWASPGSLDADQPAWQLVATALAEGFASRLNLRFREEEGWTYSVEGAYYEDRPDSGHTFVSLETAGDTLAPLLAALREELDRMRDHGPTQDELDAALRRQWRTSGDYVQTLPELASILWFDHLHALPPGELVRRVAAYRDVSLEEARAAARRWLSTSRLLVVTGDADSAKRAVEGSGWPAAEEWTPCEAVYGGRCP